MTDVPISAPHPHRPSRRESAAPAPTTAEPTYIGLVTRAIAFALDAAIINAVAVIVAAASALIISIFPVGHTFKVVVAAIGAALYVLWLVGYFASFWSTTGQTPGNRAMRIRVVRTDGTLLSFMHALLRFGALVLAALPLMLGFAPILFNDRRRGLQDVLAGTVVVDVPVAIP